MKGSAKLVRVHALPWCDFCPPETKRAIYDFKTKQSSWANACYTHWIEHRMFDKLGLGKGQKMQKIPEPAPEPEMEPTAAELHIALEASLKLQSHYAQLLNIHDGGDRLIIDNVDDWIKRLRNLTTGTS